eukprot:TRINITY_DN477_c0_g1_i1.p1 TRINITY_DN477_c0_g1~~TRINITY_DN477_c0_g1_i1.p1  ORF type:complete len:114 (-),score=4.68 TRINITY_DN477_c0_g1_i1:10-351(-)
MMWNSRIHSLDLPSEGATFCEPRQASSRLAKHHVTAATEYNRLSVAVNSRDLYAPRTFHVHEKAVRRLDHTLQLMFGLFLLRIWMQEIDIHCCEQKLVFHQLCSVNLYRAKKA